jgi:hypothetical protein
MPRCFPFLTDFISSGEKFVAIYYKYIYNFSVKVSDLFHFSLIIVELQNFWNSGMWCE